MPLPDQRASFARPAAPAAVLLKDVSRSFADRAVLDQINLTIRPGEFVAVLGPSGTGKTTLLRLLAGLDQVDAGSIIVPAVRSVVFQEPRLVPAKRVWENVVLGRRGAAARARAGTALTEVGLAGHADAWPSTLSGGEAQRVALARALVREPGLLLLDEPFAALDALTRIKMHDLVLQLWQRHHPAVVLVTHDVDEAILLADRILVLSNGAIGVELPVGLSKPRDRADPLFAALRAQLLAELGVGASTAAH
ncbi:ABC transporter ATP-binding protein [Bradyrhizobium sp. dw_411]|uniref:ABC transporter ATP-binding protein n=1 Tax=Bradyrhizobium sp. dw_411 TaxID=2720082 RepID=UPI00201BD174|nr:ABC transporter ATP-binding protein [Bradyrhizobium sp. dw_411]